MGRVGHSAAESPPHVFQRKGAPRRRVANHRLHVLHCLWGGPARAEEGHPEEHRERQGGCPDGDECSARGPCRVPGQLSRALSTCVIVVARIVLSMLFHRLRGVWLHVRCPFAQFLICRLVAESDGFISL